MLSRAVFDNYVRDALANLYDPVRLQTHPLGELLLTGELPQETRAQMLRERLREAIEYLRPPPSVSFGDRAWYGYRILWSRYVEGKELEGICTDLAISLRSLYRYQREALEALTALLWEQCQSAISHPQEASQPVPTEPEEAEALRIALAAPREWVNLRELLSTVEQTVRPLVEQQGIRLRFAPGEELPPFYGSPTVLRQIFINALTVSIRHAAGRRLQLALMAAGGCILGELQSLDLSPLRRNWPQGSALRILRTLLRVYEGLLWFEGKASAEVALCLALPLRRPRAILVIDDDADTVELLRRYLQPGQYQLWVARDRTEVRQWLGDSSPDLVILDILMPKEDGWTILQEMRAQPNMARVPVIVCSVLDEPRLARALGANRVLHKPLDREALLQTVRDLLQEIDSSAQLHPAAL